MLKMPFAWALFVDATCAKRPELSTREGSHRASVPSLQADNIQGRSRRAAMSAGVVKAGRSCTSASQDLCRRLVTRLSDTTSEGSCTLLPCHSVCNSAAWQSVYGYMLC